MTARMGLPSAPKDSRPTYCASCGGWPATQHTAHDRRERLCTACAIASDVHADNGGR